LYRPKEGKSHQRVFYWVLRQSAIFGQDKFPDCRLKKQPKTPAFPSRMNPFPQAARVGQVRQDQPLAALQRRVEGRLHPASADNAVHHDPDIGRGVAGEDVNGGRPGLNVQGCRFAGLGGQAGEGDLDEVLAGAQLVRHADGIQALAVASNPDFVVAGGARV
jgi:hypothetical protein